MTTASLVSLVVIGVITAALFVVAARRPGRMPSAAFRDALEQGKSMVPRMLVGILAASFLAEILPKETIGAWAGVESGWRGILLASLIGALAPTGPMVLFPVMIALMEAGVGLPQTVAFLTSWGMLAVHRVLVWELPMMGINFVIVRLAASVALVPLSGFLAGWIADWLHA